MARAPLKILAIVPSAFCFGLQNAELALFSRLRRTMQCHFLNTRWTDGEFGRRLDALGMPHSSTWFGMFSRRLDWRNVKMTAECLLRLPTTWRDFIRLYRSFRPDIIYFANHHEIILLFPLLLLLRRKIVCHMHDPPPAIAFQKVSFFVWRRCVGRFLCISNDARARLSRLGRLAPVDAVVQNGVEVLPLALPRRRSDKFNASFGWPARSVVFGICGQISPDKGQEDFIEAAELVRQRDPNVRFVIAGRGPDQYVAELQQRIAARSLGSHIKITGWLASVAEFYEAIDVLVLASRHDEGFGLVLAEAGERGLPSIATRSGGAVEVVLDGVTGILVDKQAPAALAEAMLRLAADMRLCAEMGRRARERVAEAFNLDVQAQRVADYLAASAR